MAKVKYSDVSISDLLDEEKEFSLVLPHFQRGFVWDAKNQKNLLLSLLAGVPTGYILILTDKNDKYYNRPLCFNLDTNIETDPVKYLLDGQQRISTMKSMFTDLLSEKEKNRFAFAGVKSVKEMQKKLPRALQKRWFLQIDGKPDPDGQSNPDDIFGLQELESPKELPEKFEDKLSMLTPQDFDDYVVHTPIKAEYASTDNGTTTTHEIQGLAARQKRLPLWKLQDGRPLLRNILKEIAKEHCKLAKQQDGASKDALANKIDQWAEKVVDFLHDNLLHARMGMLEVPADSRGMSIGVPIFEQVNRRGMRLDVYDLLVARAADEKFNLTEKIESVVDKPHQIMRGIMHADTTWDPMSIGIWDQRDSTLSRAFRTLFRNCLPICVLNADRSRDLSSIANEDIKEKRLLELSRDQIRNNWKDTVQNILHVLQFLHFRCGLMKVQDIPYELMVIPLFVCFIDQSRKGEYNSDFIDKLEFWWWASIFSGHYQDRQGPKVVEDSKHFLKDESFSDRLEGVFAKKGYSDEATLVDLKSPQRFTQLELALQQYVLSKEPYDLNDKKQREKITAVKIATGKIRVHNHHVVPVDEMASNGAAQLRKNRFDPVNGPFNKTLVSDKTNYKIKRVSDYDDSAKCKSNLMPLPSAEKYKKAGEKYQLKEFLHDRFELIEENVKEHLHSLSAKR